MRWARIPAVALGAILAAIGAGCSKSEPEGTPAACLNGPGAYTTAVRAAPGEVRLGDDTPISDCLADNQEAGDLADVGSAMVAAATALNNGAHLNAERGLADPSSDAALQAGYLVGAAERGAEGTSGIHQDLILRLNAAARFSPSGHPSPAFRRAFARGYRAGRETG